MAWVYHINPNPLTLAIAMLCLPLLWGLPRYPTVSY
jgi:hypothetical protein